MGDSTICACNGRDYSTPYCPYCGTKKPVKPKCFRAEGFNWMSKKKAYAIKTDHFRVPMKGEYYLSGASPMAYKAPNDLSQAYRIMQIIEVTA